MKVAWDGQKKHLRHLLADVYPKALAQRRRVPDREAVLAFPDSYLPRSPARDPANAEHTYEQEKAWGFERSFPASLLQDEMLLMPHTAMQPPRQFPSATP